MENQRKKSMSFVISHKPNERRRVMLPEDLKQVKYPQYLFFEENYGDILGLKNRDYQVLGCQVVPREVALTKDIICEPKIGEADFISELVPGQIIFGWIHGERDSSRMAELARKKLTAYEWANMFKTGRHSFWQNNQLAGEAGVYHAYEAYGQLPSQTKVAVLGRGNTAQGAVRILTQLGAEVRIYNRQEEKLFQQEIGDYDVLVNAILWDKKRKDHIIYRHDLKRMRKNSLIIDISCDENGGIETSTPTTFEHPLIIHEGIYHYAVDHTPSIFYRTATKTISKVVSLYIDQLIVNRVDNVLSEALIIKNGVVQ